MRSFFFSRSGSNLLVLSLWVLAFLSSEIAPATADDVNLDLPVIPDWVARGMPIQDSAAFNPLRSGTVLAVENPPYCELQLAFPGTQDGFAQYFDSLAGVTRIFMDDYHDDQIVERTINSALEITELPLPIPFGYCWLAVDLDLDGNMELVVQRGDFGLGGNGYLDILSAPLWTLRRRFVMPGMKVYMYPYAVNLDDDPELEVYLTPHSIGGSAKAQIIDYDTQSNTFEITSDISAPTGTSGSPAVGDFDGDGRTEFISGNWYGYGLFEYDGSALHYIGMVVNDSVTGGNNGAVSAEPWPDGVSQVLTGHSSGANGYRYQLWEADGDNEFKIRQTFQAHTGWAGTSRCSAADTDCDTRDELLMGFFPLFKVFEYDPNADSFVVTCVWDFDTYGSLVTIAATDLDQNGVPEWGTINHQEEFQAFADTRCMTCTSPPQGLVSWWPLDEVEIGVARDVWGLASGALVGDFAALTGEVAGGLGFGGTVDFVRVPSSAAPIPDDGDFTLATWYRCGALAAVSPITSKQDTVQQRGWAVWIGDGNHIGLQLAEGAVGSYTSPNAGMIADAAWHHIAVTVDRDNTSGVAFFLDGAIIGTADPTEHTGSLNNEADLYLGAGSVLPGDISYLFGVLDEVQIFDRALDPFEIQEMFEADTLGQCKPHRICDCSKQGDITNDDGVLDILDVLGLVDYLFANAAVPVKDLTCPTVNRGDFNCDNFDDALDLCALIDVIFAGKSLPCQPCGTAGL